MKLSDVKGLKKEEINALSQNWITTAEDFISISSNVTLSRNLITLLGVTTSRYEEIVKLIESSIPQSKREEIKKFKNPQFKSGAKKPRK